MFHAFASSLGGMSPVTCFNGFSTDFDLANQLAHAKSSVIASPNTDSLAGDLSTSSGGVLRESTPQSYLTPVSLQTSNLHGSTFTRHLSADMSAATSIGGAATTATSSINNSVNNFGEGSPLFEFTSTAAAPHNGDNDDDATEMNSGLLDYAGLESLLTAAIGDGGNTSTTPKQKRERILVVPAVSAAPAPPQTNNKVAASSPQSTAPFVVPSVDGLSKGRSTNNVSPVPSRGSNSVVLGGGSPNMCSSENALLYSSLGSEFISGGLPPAQLVPTHEDRVGAVDATSPLMLAAVAPVVAGATDHSNTGQTSCTVSHSAASTGGSASISSQPNDAEVRSNLFVCGLPMTVTDKELADIFGEFGPIESAKVMLDIHTGRSRGIAFVKFSKVEHAENAVDMLNGTSINGHPIIVRVANSRAAYLPGNPTNKTFVRNVPLAVPWSALMAYFSQFGEVTDLSIKSDTAQGRHHGSSTGGRSTSTDEDTSAEQKLNIVFITYTTKEAAAKAAEATHTKTPFAECGGVPLLAKVAEDTTRRMERLSRRLRAECGVDSKETCTANTAARPLNYASTPSMIMTMPMKAAATAAGGFTGSTYVTLPGIAGADLASLSMMPANGHNNNNSGTIPQLAQPPAQPHMSLFHNANGNPIYAATAATTGAALAPAQAGVAYSIQGGFPQSVPPTQQHQGLFFATQTPPQPHLQPQPPQLQPQKQPMYIQASSGIMATQVPQFQIIQHVPQQQQQQQGAPGQIMYMQTSNGAVVPVVYGGATSTGSVQPQAVNSYCMMINNLGRIQ